MDRESIYAALFARLSTLTGYGFKTVTRRYRQFANLPSNACPSMYMQQVSETVRPIHRQPAQIEMEVYVHIVAYLSTTLEAAGSGGAVLNPLIDLIGNVALAPDSAPDDMSACTLGGRVVHARIEGEIAYGEGDADAQQSHVLAIVPIRILVTAA